MRQKHAPMGQHILIHKFLFSSEQFLIYPLLHTVSVSLHEFPLNNRT
jgi:hypothetical protein